jgi:hypothetical protein
MELLAVSPSIDASSHVIFQQGVIFFVGVCLVPFILTYARTRTDFSRHILFFVRHPGVGNVYPPSTTPTYASSPAIFQPGRMVSSWGCLVSSSLPTPEPELFFTAGHFSAVQVLDFSYYLPTRCVASFFTQGTLALAVYRSTDCLDIHPHILVSFFISLYRRHVLCRFSSDGVGGPAPDEDARRPSRGAYGLAMRSSGAILGVDGTKKIARVCYSGDVKGRKMGALGSFQEGDEVTVEMFPPSMECRNRRTELLSGIIEGQVFALRREQVEQRVLFWGALLPPDPTGYVHGGLLDGIRIGRNGVVIVRSVIVGFFIVSVMEDRFNTPLFCERP